MMQAKELLTILAAEKASSLGGNGNSDLAQQRSRAIDYYLGDMDDMAAPEGRSQAVSSDVADTVEQLMPTLMEIFTAGDDIVEFRPVGPEDVEAARQETDYVNHVFMEENEGFLVLYTFCKDALLSKVGVVKFWWEEREHEDRKTFYDQPDEAFTIVAADPDIEVVEHTEKPSPDGATHDFTVLCRGTKGSARIAPVPPEEFRISKRARSIADSPYCAHVVRRSISDLVAEGYERKQLDRIGAAAAENDEETLARQTISDEDSDDGDTMNRAMREIEVTEHYIRLDYDDDGKAELRKITTGGSGDGEILKRNGKAENEPCDRMPFAAMTPIIMTHRFFGRSIADLTIEVQRIKTALIRALLDNAYFANNQRTEVSESHASDNTLDDLLTNRPGGVVRTRQPGGLLPIPQPGFGFDALSTIEYIDTVREQRTGTMRFMQGMKSDTLHETASGANQMLNMAQQRVKLIARIFAETGIKDLFLGLHALVCKHASKPDVVRLRGKWIPVDPREWKSRNDMTVAVGLGAGSRETQQAFLMQILGVQMQAVAAQGPDGPMVKLKNIFATLKQLVENAGLRDVERFFADPESGPQQPPQAPPPDPKLIEVQGKLALEEKKLQIQTQADQIGTQAKLSADQQRMQQEFQLKQYQMEREHELKREQLAAELALKRDEMVAEAQMRREAMMVDAQIKREVGLAGASARAEAMKSGKIPNGVTVGGEPG